MTPRISAGTRNSMNPNGCKSFFPMMNIWSIPPSQLSYSGVDYTTGCVLNMYGGSSGEDVGRDIASWLEEVFKPDSNNPPALGNTFTAAAFLANQVWLLTQDGRLRDGYDLYHDMGMSSMIPKMSLTGIIAGSVMLGVQLISLLGFAVYAACGKRLFDKELDSWAMMELRSSCETAKLISPARRGLCGGLAWID